MLGIVLPGGRVAFASDQIVVDEEFTRIAHEQPRSPEQRFRFSNSCVRGACRQWDEDLDGVGVGGCSLVDRLMGHFEHERGPIQADDSLPDCSIRDDCRWFKQRGGAACAICPEVITDMTASEDDLPPRVVRVRDSLKSSGSSE